MNLVEFQEKWRGVQLKESASAKEHFLDLCHVLGMATPAEVDKTGSFYTFEKGATKTSGGQGFADVWFRGHFAWEYKGPDGDLDKAYRQLKQYVEALENPPLLVVSDLERFEIHTNFTNTRKEVHAFTLDGIDATAPSAKLSNLKKLTALWTEPELLRPETKVDAVTEDAAARFGALAAALHARGHEPHRVAHYLMQLLFCLFAEDVGLLPRGLFTQLLGFGAKQPAEFQTQIRQFLTAMAGGGFVNYQTVPRFNGGLFAEVDPLPLTGADLTELAATATLDWSSVEPAIFGTLFERSLDPGKRAQLGAHYTGRADIERVVEPVVMAPLRRRWDAVRAEAEAKKGEWEAAATPQTRQNRKEEFAAILGRFQEELTKVRILDPACGSGNFLYVALAKLLDLEKEALVFGAANGLPLGYPRVGPGQLHGLEINEYARELAQVVVWIGYLKWKLDNGFPGYGDPVLEPLETIRLQDALLDLSDPDNPKEAAWPAADYIIGNPPFLGSQKLKRELGEDYIRNLWTVFKGRIAPTADLSCYFFEKARDEISDRATRRAGLLANTTIKQPQNRGVLQRIKDSGDIFNVWSNEPWILEGASVRIAIIAFDSGVEPERYLDGQRVASIGPDLSVADNLLSAKPLAENRGICFQGVKKHGPFEVPSDLAEAWLNLPVNPNGKKNSEVVRRFWIGRDLTGRPVERWIVDFGPEMPETEAAMFEAPFRYVATHVKPEREMNNRAAYRERWWIHGEARPGLRRALRGLDRYLATVRVSRHRNFIWANTQILPDSRIIVFARQDDYFFGVLQSRAHEVWSLRMASRHGVGNDPTYNVGDCFETFPLPWPPGSEPWRDERLHAIASAARVLDEVRNNWLNPPDATEAALKKRTLTNLYNERPTWLANLHAALDRAVWAAYGWDDDPCATSDEEILARLLALNAERASSPKPQAPSL